MPMKRYKHEVVIQEKVVTQNAYGEEVIIWEDLVILQALVDPTRGRKYLDNPMRQGEQSARILARPHPGVRQGHRALFREHVYEIIAVNNEPTERRHVMELAVIERLSDTLYGEEEVEEYYDSDH